MFPLSSHATLVGTPSNRGGILGKLSITDEGAAARSRRRTSRSRKFPLSATIKSPEGQTAIDDSKDLAARNGGPASKLERLTRTATLPRGSMVSKRLFPASHM